MLFWPALHLGLSLQAPGQTGGLVKGPLLTAPQLAQCKPDAALEASQVIDTLMAALHRDNADSPDRPYLGCEVVLRFLSSTHEAASLDKAGGPPALERYLRQPHKQALRTWGEYRPVGQPIVIEREQERDEAYQQLEVCNPEGECQTVRWLLVREEGAWRVDGVFSAEPDEVDPQLLYKELREAQAAPLDPSAQQRLFAELDTDGSGTIDEEEMGRAVSRLGIRISEADLHALFLEVDADGSGAVDLEEFAALLARANSDCPQGDVAAALARSTSEISPRQVVELVMRGMRTPDEPYRHHGLEETVRYCSPTNRASSVSPEAFSAYLEEPWYQILREWNEIEIEEEEDDDEDEESMASNTAEVEVLVRRDPADSFSIVAFQLSRHNARWLIDSLAITE